MRIHYALKVATLLLVVGLAACSTYRPLPVHEPTPAKVPGRVYPLRGMPPPIDLEEAKHALYEYANAYMAHVETLNGATYTAADATMFGGLVGTAGGLTKSPQTAIAGTVIAGGAGLFAQRYSLPVQTSSYLGAAQAMECMATVLIYGTGPDVTDAWEEEVAAPGRDQIDFAFLNQRIDQVRRKLRASLASIETSRADLTALKSSLAEQIEAERKAKIAREEMRAAQEVKAKAENAHRKQIAIADRASGRLGSVAGARVQSVAEINTAFEVSAAVMQIAKAADALKRADRAVIHASLAACADAY